MERKTYKNSEENHRKILLSLAEIMKTKPFNEISVIDVCKTANVSKNTFYRHYKSLSDVLYQNLEEVTADTLTKISVLADFDEVCLKSCKAWYENKEFFAVFAREEVSYILKNNIKKRMIETYAYANIKAWDNGIFIEYYSTVFCLILKWWAGRNFADPPEKVANYMVEYFSGTPLKKMKEKF